jgi:hypothetical protein
MLSRKQTTTLVAVAIALLAGMIYLGYNASSQTAAMREQNKLLEVQVDQLKMQNTILRDSLKCAGKPTPTPDPDPICGNALSSPTPTPHPEGHHDR